MCAGGQLYDVGWGQKLFMHCMGEGLPTGEFQLFMHCMGEGLDSSTSWEWGGAANW